MASISGYILGDKRRDWWLSIQRTLPRHLTLTLQIALVSNDHHWEVVLVLDAENLLLESGNFLEALARRNVVDEQEALASPHVLFAHGTVLLLAGGVEDIEQSEFIVNIALLAV